MVEATVTGPTSRIGTNGNGHHDDTHDKKAKHEPSAARKALIGIFNFTLGKLQEFTQNDIIADRDGFKAVFKITSIIGNMVTGDDEVGTDDIQASLSEMLDGGKKQQHREPVKKPKGMKRESKPDAISIPRPKTPLTPQEARLVEFLAKNYKKGKYIPTQMIEKALGITHVSPLITKVREKGILVRSAKSDRADGIDVSETESGYILNMN